MSRQVWHNQPVKFKVSDVQVMCDVPLIKANQWNSKYCHADARYETSVHDVCEQHLMVLFRRGTISREEVQDLLMEEMERKMDRKRGRKGKFTGLIRRPGHERREPIEVIDYYGRKQNLYIQEQDLES